MSCWSAENATNAYLRVIKMGKREKEPEAAEFISALVAGTNARLTVMVCADAVDYSTTLALVAAAQQTGGKVICILPGANELQLSKDILGQNNAENIKFVIGNAQNVLENEYREADCIVIDCNLTNCEGILKTAKGFGRNVMVLGYNAFWRCQGLDGHLLPIGEGLLVSRVAAPPKSGRSYGGSGKKSRWVVKVDEFTGEEHVFRVRN
ncbi:hypothetical protein BUALT_Bualt06G0125000 [Buddleja alternifolia]|uniref:Uncharacterized protein n=1 Tax=Buddleja alternifolia TaxID=168488 RepID=A0AAV6XGA3_9LAMI|nr:hypothetical protein BUALT_Bualt06G0125000 [Buddleja alternifolia]